MSLVEIEVRSVDMTDFGSILAKVAALRAAIKGMGGVGMSFLPEGNVDAKLAQLAAKMRAHGLADFLDINQGTGKIDSQLMFLKRRIEARGISDLLDLNVDTAKAEQQIGDLAGTIRDEFATSIVDGMTAGFRKAGSDKSLNLLMGMGGGGGGGRGGGFVPWWLGGGGFFRKFNLFGGGGGSGLPLLLGTVTGLHLLVDGFIELAAVIVPAAVAFGAFGAAAVPTVQDIVTQMQNLQTVSEATGHNLYPITGAFNQIAQAVRPEVLQLFGQGLVLINSKTGEFQQLATGAGYVVDQLGARLVAAVTHGNGFNKFLSMAVSDLAKLGDIGGNLFGAFGNLLNAVPGYAQDLLNLADSGSKVLEWATGVSQPVIRAGLAFHGAFLYIGLGATLIGKAMSGGLLALGNFAANLGSTEGKLASFGTFGSKAAGALRIFGVEAAGASQLPWGWIAVAAVGIGVLAYKILTAKDATQQWLANMQAALGQQGAGNFNAILVDQSQVATRLAIAQRGLAQAQKQTNFEMTDNAARAYVGAASSAQVYQAQVNELTSGQRVLSDESNLYNFRLTALGHTYGGTNIAQGLLVASGVKMSDMLAKNSDAWARIRAAVAAAHDAYRAMGQTGGVLGHDMSVLNFLAGDQYQQMQKLNQALDTYLGLTTQLEQSNVGAMQTFRQLNGQMKVNGATFTGVNGSSLTLQNTFGQLIQQTHGVEDGMRNAQAPTVDLARYIATLLSPAAHNGALQNGILRTEIFKMAQEAGYAGPNQISSLMHWIDKYSGSLRNIPRLIDTSIKAHATGSFSISQRNAIEKANLAKTRGFAGGSGGTPAGWAWVGEAGPELMNLPAGTQIMSNNQSMAFARGFAEGTFGPLLSALHSGSYGWDRRFPAMFGTDFDRTMAADIRHSIQSFMAMGGGRGPFGGRTSAGGSYNRSMLENLWQQAGGPGGMTALIAAAIALAESGGNPQAFNPSGASGLWQILGQVFPGNIFNPFVNALNAVKKFDMAGGFSPWVTYTSGAYRSFMDNGGWLRPGWNPPMYNGTGSPEYIGGSGRGSHRHVIEFRAGGNSELERAIVGIVKKAVRETGAGDVQTALGQRY